MAQLAAVLSALSFATATATATVLLGPPVQRPTLVPEHEPNLALTWSAPLECPEASSVLEQVEKIAPGLSGQESSASVVASVDREGDGYSLEFELRDGHGSLRRSLRASDCDEAAHATALLIAVLLDPLSSARTLDARVVMPEPESIEPAEPTQNEADALPGVAAPPDPLEATTSIQVSEPETSAGPPEPVLRPTKVRAALRLIGGGGYGPTNTGTGMLGGSVAAFGDRWRTEIGGTWIPPRSIRTSNDVGGVFDGWFIAVRGCFVPTLRRLELPTCVAFEVGELRGRGVAELPLPLEASFLWLAPNVSQGLWFAPIDQLAIGVQIELAAPLVRGRFLVEDLEIQRIAPVSVRGLAGIELRLPRARR